MNMALGYATATVGASDASNAVASVLAATRVGAAQPAVGQANAMPMDPAPHGTGAETESAEPEEVADAGAPAADDRDAEKYGPIAMHVYQDQDGVQAWIRDTQLRPYQEAAVGQALAVELGASGQKLRQLTVNGRRVPVAASDAITGQEHGAPSFPSISNLSGER